jgi:catechol 2,3-dioxygenase-like lactoylglutathione lyase family enzyme
MIKAIKFVTVPVTDQNRALDFYTRTLGFKITTDQPFNDTQRWIELRISGSDTGLVLFTPDGFADRIGTFQGLSFLVDDVKKTYDELKAKGVEFTGPPQVADWGSSAVFKDPDGNQFVMSSK